MAAATKRLRFSNAVYVAPARPLIEVAKQVATASVLSEGRVSLGVGVGWMREEYELMGQDFDTRGKRLNEMIPALRELWRGGWVSWSGQYYQVPEMMIEPHPEAPVPILCGGESEAALRRAARLCDGWVGYAYAWDDAVGYAEKLTRPAARVRTRERAVRHPSGAARTADARSVQARRGHRHHAGDVRAMDGPGSAAGDAERFREPIERFAETIIAKVRALTGRLADYPRDMVGYGPNPPHPQWPGGANIAVQFVLNYEEGAENSVLHGDQASETFLSEIVGAQPFPNRHMSMESLYEYGSRAGLWRRAASLRPPRAAADHLRRGHGARSQSAGPRGVRRSAATRSPATACAGCSYQLVEPEVERGHIAEAVRLMTELTGEAPLGWYTGRDSPQTRDSSSNTAASCTTPTPTPTICRTGRRVDGTDHLVVPYTLDTNDMRFASPADSTAATSSSHTCATHSTCCTPKARRVRRRCCRSGCTAGWSAAGAHRRTRTLPRSRAGPRQGVDRPSHRHRATLDCALSARLDGYRWLRGDSMDDAVRENFRTATTSSKKSSSTGPMAYRDADSPALTPASSSGVAPTGTKVSIAGIHIDRFQGDTLVAHRGQLDMHGLLEQLKGQ